MGGNQTPAGRAETSQTQKRHVVFREFRAARELVRLSLKSPALLAAPKGSETIMVIPGFSANDSAMAPLRAYLSGLDHTVSGWGLGTNRGQVQAQLPRVINEVEKRYVENNDEPVVLVGWSLGGVFAREVARNRPELVNQVFTLATPIYPGSSSRGSAESGEKAAVLTSQLIHQPITAFYTQHDNVIDWRTCLDEANPNVEMIEVDSSHLGITLDPTVWLEVANRLADRWL